MSKKARKKGEILLEVKNLRVHFPIHGGVFKLRVGEVKAVDGVSFAVRRGETLGLVGESGCGKSTTGKAIINLLTMTAPGVELHGQIIYHSEDGPVDLQSLSNSEMRPYRSKIQMIFQDPYSSLNPRLTVGQIVEEPLLIHTDLNRTDREAKVKALLERVGLGGEQAARYPHEFSGGQRQRIGIARALASEPEIIVADEPVSALDVSIQAQIINLLARLRRERSLSYVFIAHDLSVVRHISDRVAVMYLGKIVEIAPENEIYESPKHPYTKALLSAIPIPDPAIEAKRERIILEGDVPSPSVVREGCDFASRCPEVMDECRTKVPELRRVGAEGHFSACHLHPDGPLMEV